MPHSIKKQPGYSLPELLVSILIGGLITLSTVTLLSRELLANRGVEGYQRLRRQVSHARHFIERETAAASRLENGGSNKLQLAGVNADGSSYTISYQLVAADSAGIEGVSFRGPFVLLRSGPSYLAPTDSSISQRPVLNTSVIQKEVILDGLSDPQSFTISSSSAANRAARLAIKLSEAGNSYSTNFTLAISSNPSYSLLQEQNSVFVANCPGSPTPAGCRIDAITKIQEWDTTRMSSSTITPVGSPAEVIVYFNRPKPVGTDSIRGSASSTNNPPSPCTQSGCFIDFGNGSSYSIGTTAAPLMLVFTNEVVAVPRS